MKLKNLSPHILWTGKFPFSEDIYRETSCTLRVLGEEAVAVRECEVVDS